MRIALRHQLRLSLEGSAAHAVQQLLVTPLSGPSQTVFDWTVTMNGIAEAPTFYDAFGNCVRLVGQRRLEGDIDILIEGSVETHDRNGVLGRIGGEPVPALFRRVTALTKSRPDIHEGFVELAAEPRRRVELLHGLMEHLRGQYRFGPEPDEAQEGADQQQSQSADTNQSQGQSQSQSQGQDSGAAAPGDGTPAAARQAASAADFAHMFIGALRALAIPARFVSGYLAEDGTVEPGHHAWAEAWDESLGWVAFDPALGYCPTDRHIRVATGLDAAGTRPVRAVPAERELRQVSLDFTFPDAVKG